MAMDMDVVYNQYGQRTPDERRGAAADGGRIGNVVSGGHPGLLGTRARRMVGTGTRDRWTPDVGQSQRSAARRINELVAAQPMRRALKRITRLLIAPGGGRQQSAGSASKIIEIDPTSLRRGGESRCQIQCLIDQGRLGRDGLLAHVTQDRHLGACGDDRISMPSTHTLVRWPSPVRPRQRAPARKCGLIVRTSRNRAKPSAVLTPRSDHVSPHRGMSPGTMPPVARCPRSLAQTQPVPCANPTGLSQNRSDTAALDRFSCVVLDHFRGRCPGPDRGHPPIEVVRGRGRLPERPQTLQSQLL